MEPFATQGDYEERYGADSDPERVMTLLSDATAFVAAQPGFLLRDGDDLQKANLVRVTCAVVNRSLSAGRWAGLSSVSQGAGGQTASASVYNPSGDFYLTKAEKAALGIGGARVGATDPFGKGGGDGD